MKDNEQEEGRYNLVGGRRHVLLVHGEVKAVAPGLRLVEPTPEEKRPFDEAAAKPKPKEYGLPV